LDSINCIDDFFLPYKIDGTAKNNNQENTEIKLKTARFMHRAVMIDEFQVMVLGGVGYSKRDNDEEYETLNSCEIVNLAA